MSGVVVQFRLDGLAEAQKGVQQFADNLRKAGKAANDADAGGFRQMSATLTSWGSSLISVGNRLTLGLTLPLVAAGVAALKFANDANE